MASSKFDRSTAMLAAERGDIAAVIQLLSTDPSAVTTLATDSRGRKSTLLQAAARNGHPELVRQLIKYDCPVNVPEDDTGNTPLMLTLSNSHEDVADELLNHEKCLIDVQNKAGWTATMLAARKGLLKALEQLLMKGPDLEIETPGDGETALTLAVLAGQDEAVKMLVEFGAQVGHRNGSGCTPLELAWRLGDVEDAEFPVESKSRWNQRMRRIIEALGERRRRVPGGRSADSDEDESVDEAYITTRLIAGRYKNLGTLGNGAHGLALLVRDMRSNWGGHGRDSRLKVLKQIQSQRRRGIQRDDRPENRELRLLKQLNHSCVLSLLDYFNDEETLCLVTEYCELKDLHTWIQWASANDIALPFNLVTHWFLQMLLGLNYLHEQNIVHGDFKPSNVFVQSDATLRIGDFGCSRQLAGAEGAGSISGTWIYMSPEVISNEGRLTASDMWSLGCTLYELCTGQPLFNPNLSRRSLHEKICSETDRKYELPSLLPAWLSAALPRLLHRSPPSERPTAAALLLEENVTKSLREMQPDRLAEDRRFLADNFAGVMDDGHDDVAKKYASYQSVDYSQAYDALIADVERLLAASSHSALAQSETMAHLENLRTKLEKKKIEENFPLEDVYELILKEAETQQGSEGTRAGLERSLAKLTKDTEGCEMVQLAILLERQCLPSSSE